MWVSVVGVVVVKGATARQVINENPNLFLFVEQGVELHAVCSTKDLRCGPRCVGRWLKLGHRSVVKCHNLNLSAV